MEYRITQTNPDHPNEDVKYTPVDENGHNTGAKPTYLSTFYSLAEFGESALRRSIDPATGQRWGADKPWVEPPRMEHVKRMADMAMGKGWSDVLPEVLDLAQEAVRTMLAEHEIETFHPVYDVAGADVEIGRYCAGDPEHMIDYPIGKVSRMGTVIALIVSTDAMASVGSQEFRLRGQVLTALAMALQQLGHSTEFWVDMGAGFSRGSYHSRIRIKGPDEILDPAMLLLAYCHRGMLDGLQFASEDGNKVSRPGANGGSGRGGSEGVFTEGLPGDMINIPDPMYGANDPKEELVRYLRLMGLISREGV